MKTEDLIDEESYDYIHKGVQKLKVYQVFKPIIESILIRRAYEFKLSFPEIKREIDLLNRNLEYISIEEFSEEDSRVGGSYCSSDKTIKINLNILKKDLETGKYISIYELLAHELTHALCVDEEGYDILAIRDGKEGKTCKNMYDENVVNYSLLELIVSEIGGRLTTKRENRSIYLSQAISYNCTSEMLEMLEAAYGVKEEDLLKSAIKGRTELARFFSKKSKETVEDVLSNLDKFELNYNFVHNTIYMPEEKRPPKENRYVNFGNGCVSMYELCAIIMNTRMINTNIPTIEEATQFTNRLKFDFNKLHFLMESFSKRIVTMEQDESFDYDLFYEVNKTKYLLAKKILVMQKILDDTNIPHDKKLEEFNRIKNMNPEEIEFEQLDQNSIRTFEFEIDPETQEYYKEEDIDWDNEEVFEYIKAILGKRIDFEYKKNKAMNNPNNPFKQMGYMFGEILNDLKEAFKYVYYRINPKKQKRLPIGVKEGTRHMNADFVQKVSTPKITQQEIQQTQEHDKIKE